MRVNRLTRAGAVLASVTLAMLVGTPAYAAAPANDTFAGAVVIGSLPFETTLNTSEATTDAADAEMNADCGAPATDASVWYSFTAASDGYLLADVSDSNYTAGVAVVTGAPGSFEMVWCGPDTIAFEVLAGQTYHLVAFDDQYDGGGNGGTLALSLGEAPPPPALSFTVDPTARFNPQTGTATVSGTIVCEGDVDFAGLIVELNQKVGRGVVSGFGETEIVCNGAGQKWSVEVYPYSGTKFAGGKAASFTLAYACGTVFCSDGYEEHTVKLSRR